MLSLLLDKDLKKKEKKTQQQNRAKTSKQKNPPLLQVKDFTKVSQLVTKLELKPVRFGAIVNIFLPHFLLRLINMKSKLVMMLVLLTWLLQ